MKHADLRAAAHNMADSISSETSFLSRDPGFHVWRYVDALPDKKLRVDLLNGLVLTPGIQEERVLKFFADFGRIVPEILARHRCSPVQVTAIELEFRGPAWTPHPSQELLVTVEQTGGRRSTDRYFGWPLKRRRILDALGRIRRDRAPRNDS